MQEQINKLTSQVSDLSKQVEVLAGQQEAFNNYGDMPIEFQRTLLQRLGMEGFKGLTFGLVTLINGVATITDPKITTTSVIIVTPTISYNPAGTWPFAGLCSAGSASILEGSLTASDPINYVIFY